MRFGLIHRIMTDALATLGLLALVTSGELNRWLTIVVVLGLVAALAIPERWQDRPTMRKLAVAAPLGLFTVQLTRLFLDANLLELAIEFAAGLQVVRLATRRGAAHDQQVIVLSLLHLIAGTVLGSGLAYGLCFIGFLIVAPGALVLSHLRREVEGNYRQGARDRTGLPVDVPRILRSRRVIGRSFLAFTCLLSIPIFVFTALLFVLFPRVGLSLLLLSHSRPERMVGFSEKVDLGGVGRLRSDPTIVMRVDVPDLPTEPPSRLALYLRGTAFDMYRGKSWSRTSPRGGRAEQIGTSVRIRRFPDPARDRKMRIDLEPIDPSVLFLPPDAVALAIIAPNSPYVGPVPQISLEPEGGYSYKSPDERGIRYEVSLAGPNELAAPALSPEERARYLSLPPDLPPRIADKAKEWVGAAIEPRIMARLIEHRLRRDYRYDLDSPSGSQKNPLDHFLFESKRGHCEFYSTSMAIMLRTLGVPTRNVTGFIGGTYNRFAKSYAVRQGDAHSWVEVYFEGQGWTRFDPTPPADAAPQSDITGVLAFVRDFVEAAAQRWNRHVVGYDLRQQTSLFRSVRERYSELRSRPGVVGKTLSSPRRIAFAIIGLGMLAGAIYFIRKRRRGGSEGARKPTEEEIFLHQVVELYKALESAMALRGVPRIASTPPLAHARSLMELGHPIGAEVLALTELYIRARFAGIPLTDDERRDFARRIRLLRQREKTEKAAA